MDLNGRALRRSEELISRAEERRVVALEVEGGGRFVDCGIDARGGLLAGLDLARICLADLAEVAIVPAEVGGRPCPAIRVTTDHPVAACLGSQYAGWAISEGKFFAMGSGPMRAAYGHEGLFEELGLAERPDAVVGVLEGRKPPTPAVFLKIAEACRVAPSAVTLLGAPTASLAGGAQVVARSVETALHKLHQRKFDLRRVVSAHGVAPIPPVARDDLAAIGRTNDAILYGASVLLYVTGDDPSLEEVGPGVPSDVSKDHGEPFAAIFARYNHDFYAVDPHLFSPAEVVFQNLETGRTHAFGKLAPDVLTRSFFERGWATTLTHLVALVSGFGWHVQDLRRASGVVGVAFDPIPFAGVVGRVGRGSRPIEAGGVDLSKVDGVLVRMMPPGSLEQVVFRMDALHRLVRLGVTVMNPPGAVEAAVDKYLASARLDAEGLPVPETWVGESADDAMVAFESLGGDVAVKPLFGSEGRGLVRVSDPELAWRTFRTLERLDAVLYVQKYVRNPGHDVRAFVLGGRILGAMRRYAMVGEWRTNVAVGGHPEACTLDDQAERLALRSASAIGASMAGVDLLPDLENGRWTILEVNAVPGWKALGAATGIDVAAAILAELRDAAR